MSQILERREPMVCSGGTRRGDQMCRQHSSVCLQHRLKVKFALLFLGKQTTATVKMVCSLNKAATTS